jgi:hypothetical protein
VQIFSDENPKWRYHHVDGKMIILKLLEILCENVRDSVSSGQGPVAGSCERGNEHSCFIKGLNLFAISLSSMTPIHEISVVLKNEVKKSSRLAQCNRS